MEDKPTESELKKLAKEIEKDQIKENSAEKRVRIKATFKKAVKKMSQTPPPKKEHK